MKLLIIVYYWPPSGGAGVFRWLNFSKALLEKGHEPVILTTKDGDYPYRDDKISVPDELKVVRTYTPSLYKLSGKMIKKGEKIPYGSMESTSKDSFKKRIMLWMRLNLVAPDIRRIWNKYAFQKAEELLKTDKFDAVITSGPPHSTHLIGLKLKKRYNIKWIADFRDAWTTIPFLWAVKRNKFIRKYDKSLENKVVNYADAVLSCSIRIKKDLGEKNKIHLLHNNFNPDLYKNIIPHKFDDFSINHFGTLTAGTDFSSIKKVVIALKKKQIKFKFRFWGNIAPTLIEKVKSDYEIKDSFEFYPPIPHSEMVKYLLGSSLQLLFINNVRVDVVTLKLFEYLASQKPILGIGQIDCEPAKIINETGTGKMFDYDDTDKIVDFIYKIYSGKISFDGRNSLKYSLSHKTDELIEIIENVKN